MVGRPINFDLQHLMATTPQQPLSPRPSVQAAPASLAGQRPAGVRPSVSARPSTSLRPNTSAVAHPNTTMMPSAVAVAPIGNGMSAAALTPAPQINVVANTVARPNARQSVGLTSVDDAPPMDMEDIYDTQQDAAEQGVPAEVTTQGAITGNTRRSASARPSTSSSPLAAGVPTMSGATNAADNVHRLDGAATLVNSNNQIYRMIGRVDRITMFNDWGVGNIHIAYPDENNVVNPDMRQIAAAQNADKNNLKISGEVLDEANNEESLEDSLNKKQRVRTYSITGNALAEMVQGNLYEFNGRFRTNKHGEQFEVLSAKPILEVNIDAVKRFLERNYGGIGAVKAQEYINKKLELGRAEGKSDYEIIESIRTIAVERPLDLDLHIIGKEVLIAGFEPTESEESKTDPNNGEATPYTTPEEYERREAMLVAFVQRDLTSRIGAMGLGQDVIKTLAKAIVLKLIERREEDLMDEGIEPTMANKLPVLSHDLLQKSWNELVQNPYQFIESVKGMGFARADMMGRSFGIAPSDPRRLTALAAFVLKTGCERNGHTFLTRAQFADIAYQVDPSVNQHIDQMLGLAVDGNLLSICNDFGDERIYNAQLLRQEKELAKSIAHLVINEDGTKPAPIFKGTFEEALELVHNTSLQCEGQLAQNGLDDTQAHALAKLITAPTRLHTVTAGPGCGKTALMEVLSRILRNETMLFCASTGKAAKVLSSRVRQDMREAVTIHSLLGGADSENFQKNKNNPLSGKALCSDEMSMSGVALTRALLSAAPAQMHVILLGDADQLPSIESGRVLRDIMMMDFVDNHYLSKTYRNSGGILDVVKEVREGRLDVRDRENVKFHKDVKTSGQLNPIELQYSIGRVLGDYLNAVKEKGIENVVLATGRRKGNPHEPEFNTTYLNHVLREKLNPHALKVPGTRFFVGDRILLRENMNVKLLNVDGGVDYSHVADEDNEEGQRTRVVNGDTGVIVRFEAKETPNNAPKSGAIQVREAGATAMVLKLDDGRTVHYPADAFSAVDHAYAMTVHTTQGSEYQEVLFVATAGSAEFINRNMVYTAWSRPKESLHVYGEEALIKRIANTPAPVRNSSLVERVCGELKAELPQDLLMERFERKRMAQVRTQRPSVRAAVGSSTASPRAAAYNTQRPAQAPAARPAPMAARPQAMHNARPTRPSTSAETMTAGLHAPAPKAIADVQMDRVQTARPSTTSMTTSTRPQASGLYAPPPDVPMFEPDFDFDEQEPEEIRYERMRM